jgi:hypothetical protein
MERYMDIIISGYLYDLNGQPDLVFRGTGMHDLWHTHTSRTLKHIAKVGEIIWLENSFGTDKAYVVEAIEYSVVFNKFSGKEYISGIALLKDMDCCELCELIES